MTPEGWGFMSAAVAIAGSTAASVWSAKSSRRAQRETSEASLRAQREAALSAPYDSLAARLEKAETRIDALETELRTERERSAHAAAAFRSRIQVLLHHIAALDAYAEVLVDIIRTKVTTVTTMPKKPELPPDAADDL